MLDQAEQILGYRFQNPQILQDSMRHASSADDRLNSNERQEFLGDAILGFVISEYLFQTYPHFLEGELTKIKSAVVSRKVCAQISSELNLIQMLTLGKGMSSRPSLPPSVAAAALESIIAAIYLDGGIAPAKAFILRVFARHVREMEETNHQNNYKSVLQQFAQKNMPSQPMYLLLDEKGPDHSKAFEICVEIAGRRFPSAWANTKKDAEQLAALNALRALEQVA